MQNRKPFGHKGYGMSTCTSQCKEEENPEAIEKMHSEIQHSTICFWLLQFPKGKRPKKFSLKKALNDNVLGHRFLLTHEQG